MTITLTLQVDGMHCGGCVRNVQRTLSSLAGVSVQRVEIGTAVVHYDPDAVTPEAIATAVTDAGYPAHA